MSADTVVLVHNPHAGSGKRRAELKQVSAAIHRGGQNVVDLTDLSRLTELSSELAANGALCAVIAAGGDGTVGEVVNRTDAGIPVAVYPLGTENLLARFLGVPRSPDRFAAMIRRAAVRELDAGEANGRVFTLMIGIGFDAEVVRRLAEARQGNITRGSYFKPLVNALRSYRYPPIRVYCSSHGQREESAWTARWAFGVNVPRYALALRMCPGAAPDDGFLDVCTFSGGSWLATFTYLTACMARAPRPWDNARQHRCQTLRVECDPGASVPYQIDGDSGGVLPVAVKILPGRLRMIVPAP